MGEHDLAIRSALSEYVTRGSTASKITASNEFLREQGSFVIGALDISKLPELREVSITIAGLFCGLDSLISKTVAERGDNNSPSENQICPCLPRALCYL